MITIDPTTLASIGLGLRWAVAGPHLSFHLAGGADCVLDNIYDRLVMQYTGSAWVELSRNSNT